ncbi:hypothetical protein J6590_082196 [Homalodisca vitripennis]|nr:hypothetical protein J6590_082196 [Homalodisca vitripennis]
MERLSRGVVMSWRENNINNDEKEERRKSRTGFEKRRSGVPVLLFVCGGKSFKPQDLKVARDCLKHCNYNGSCRCHIVKCYISLGRYFC